MKSKKIYIFVIILSITTIYFRSVYYIDIPAGQKIVIMKSRDIGIGNQLFRFASAYELAKRLDAKLWIVSRQSNRSFSSKDRAFSLDKFNLTYDKFITPEQYIYIKKRHRFTLIDEDNFFEIKPSTDEIFVTEGSDNSRFESEKFFHRVAADISTITLNQQLPNNDLVKSMHDRESVAIHIRHGDFPEDRIIPITFQVQAMQKIKEMLHNPHFFVFSDDIEFIRKAFANMKDITIVSQPNMNTLSEFQLMTQCKHMIVANSTFSWWAAYLITNPHKIIIAPDFYAHSENPYRKDFYAHSFYPSKWIKIDPFILG